MNASRIKRLTFSTALACGTLTAHFSVSAANYLLTELGTLGGDYSMATGLNEAGQVVGVARTTEGREHAFLWQDGVMTDLGGLGGANSHASAINASGQVVGWAENAEGFTRACLFGVGTNADLGGGPKEDSFASDINDHGQVIGWTDTQDPNNNFPRAFLFSPTVRNLSLWGGYTVRSRAIAINNSQQVAGWSAAQIVIWGLGIQATVWNDFGSINPGSRLGGADSEARNLNDAGEIVGVSGFDYVPERAACWSGTNLLSLGSLALDSSAAAAVNNDGQIVGGSAAYRSGLITNNFPNLSNPGGDTNSPPPEPPVYEGQILTRHAFLWQEGVMADLNDLIPTNSGWELSEAASINDAGQIVGSGTFQGQTRAFLLTPSPNPNQIPFVHLVSPTEGQWLSATNLPLQADASDSDGEIRKVEFFARRVTRRDRLTGGFSTYYAVLNPLRSSHPPGYLGETTNAPFTLEVTNLAAGNYLILAKATDNQGATACAAEVLVRIHAPPLLNLSRQPFVTTVPPQPPSDTLHLRLSGYNEEMNYDLETSIDFVHWTRIELILSTSPSSVQYFPLPTSTNSHRFYRAVAR
jgi:probable HAF family extracellular repeat protein